MRMAFAEIIKSLTRFSTILATLVVGFAFVFATGVNAGAGDKKVEIKKAVPIEKIVKVDIVKKADSSKAFVRPNGVVVNNVNFNPFFRPVDEFFIPNQFVVE
jgi:hypothetical protein